MGTQNLIAITNEIDERGICVLIPTYNNDKTLERVLDGVLAYTSHVIVVNDGSTDSTSSILSKYKESLTILNQPTNKGKGVALRLGLEYARTQGYSYAITIDSDGQHYPSDIPVFVEALKDHVEEEPLLLIGSRNMNQEGIPKKSSFGNKFSNFWFWFETGISLTDTQSGYRMYPLNELAKKYFTTKFEFEIEIIVRAAWRGVKVKNIPVSVLYDSSERVSHFRPFKDFTRISILNTVLVIITLTYIIPRNFVKGFKKKSFKNFVKEDILGSGDSAAIKASSIALGTFIGLTPLWGLHSFLSLFLAISLRLNKPLAFAFSNISIPPMIPIIIYSSLQIGYFIIPNSAAKAEFTDFNFHTISNHLMQYVVGSFSLALLMSATLGTLSYGLLVLMNKNR